MTFLLSLQIQHSLAGGVQLLLWRDQGDNNRQSNGNGGSDEISVQGGERRRISERCDQRQDVENHGVSKSHHDAFLVAALPQKTHDEHRKSAADQCAPAESAQQSDHFGGVNRHYNSNRAQNEHEHAGNRNLLFGINLDTEGAWQVLGQQGGGR